MLKQTILYRLQYVVAMALASAISPPLWAAAAQSTVPLGNPTIVLGAANFADQLTTTSLATPILQKLGYKVKVVHASPGIWFAGISIGQIDLGLNGWLPVTYGAYWKKYQKDLVKLGVLYEPTKQGWAVPEYVPKSMLDSFSDLKNPAVMKKLHATITSVGPGAGETAQSRDAMKAYGLSAYGYNLQATSGPAVFAALAHAEQMHQWIVITAWTPHWAWARWKLRYLKDPKGMLGKGGKCYMIGVVGFQKKFPRATAFLKNFRLTVEQMNHIMNAADKFHAAGSSHPYEKAAHQFLSNHPKLVRSWVRDTGIDINPS